MVPTTRQSVAGTRASSPAAGMTLLSCGPKQGGNGGCSRVDFGSVEGVRVWLHYGMEALVCRVISGGSELLVTGGLQAAVDSSEVS